MHKVCNMGNSYKAIKSKHYIQDLIEEGEHEHQDFKFQISDARKIARSISAFANNDGGRLLVGVKDNGNIAGVESDEEIYMIEQAATSFCRPPQQVEFSTYRVEGKNVLKVDIKAADKKPVQAQDDDRKWRAYYRVADENMLAHPLQVKLWKCSNDASGVQFTFDDAAKKVVDYVESTQGRGTVHSCMKQLHISRSSAEELIIALCRIGTLGMEYIDGKFFITLRNVEV